MTSLYDERRAKIKLENHAAKKLLANNLKSFNLSDYMNVGSSLVPTIIKGIAQDNSKAISAGDMITRTVLPKTSIIRRIFKILSSSKRIFKLFFNK